LVPTTPAPSGPGDNLYTASIVALDADKGALRWHYQFTPHDVYDYDSVQVPVMIDNWGNTGINVVAWANRNGNYYALDRATGRFLLGKPFVKVNWMSDFDERGRPNQTPQPPGQPTYPGNQGGTNWYSPSFSRARASSTSPRGRTTRASTAEPGRVQGGTQLHRRRSANFRRGPGAPGFAALRRSTPGPRPPATAR
jgi:glucose dehydrogenase